MIPCYKRKHDFAHEEEVQCHTQNILFPCWFLNCLDWSTVFLFQVRCAVNQTFSFEVDLQEMKEARDAFMKFFEEKLR